MRVQGRPEQRIFAALRTEQAFKDTETQYQQYNKRGCAGCLI
jgi:hypothetical protein